MVQGLRQGLPHMPDFVLVETPQPSPSRNPKPQTFHPQTPIPNPKGPAKKVQQMTDFVPTETPHSNLHTPKPKRVTQMTYFVPDETANPKLHAIKKKEKNPNAQAQSLTVKAKSQNQNKMPTRHQPRPPATVSGLGFA